MVDVPLMAELLQRIDFSTTRLILVGDHNQLPPVGPGNVLRDVIQHQLVPTVVLDEVVRQAGVLKTNCSAILSGRIVPTAADDPAWTVVDAFAESQQIQVYVRDLVLDRIPEASGPRPDRGRPDHHAHAPGARWAPRRSTSMLQRLLHGDVERKFAVGDKVIQTANDYDLGVMNGTIGRVLEFEPGAGGGYWISFDGVAARGTSRATRSTTCSWPTP